MIKLKILSMKQRINQEIKTINKILVPTETPTILQKNN